MHNFKHVLKKYLLLQQKGRQDKTGYTWYISKYRHIYPFQVPLLFREIISLVQQYAIDMCHEKPDLKVFVVVIPKEGWACMAAPILLWVWHRLQNIIYQGSRGIFYGRCQTHRRMEMATRAHPSFDMTTTKTLGSVFSWRASYKELTVKFKMQHVNSAKSNLDLLLQPICKTHIAL